MLDLPEIIPMLEKKADGTKRNLAAMGREINVTRSYLNAIKNVVKVNPSRDMIKKLSDYLEKNP